MTNLKKLFDIYRTIDELADNLHKDQRYDSYQRKRNTKRYNLKKARLSFA